MFLGVRPVSVTDLNLGAAMLVHGWMNPADPPLSHFFEISSYRAQTSSQCTCQIGVIRVDAPGTATCDQADVEIESKGAIGQNLQRGPRPPALPQTNGAA